MHHPRLADHFEDFTRPHTSLFSNLAAAAAAAQHHQQGPLPNNGSGGALVTYGASGGNPATMVPSFLPIEEIYVPAQYQPLNPEDEDDVVPDQHAAFGIARAMDATGRRSEPVWRDLGLQELVRGARAQQGPGIHGNGPGGGGGGGASSAAAAAGGGTFLHASTAAAGASLGSLGFRVKEAGALMGGRRMVCLR
jgi:hypothetical protein